MKVVSLNTWGGKAGLKHLLAFFEAHKDVDIFCLQEIWNGGEEMVGKNAGNADLVGMDTNLLNSIQEVLPGHLQFFRPHFNDYYGLALFVKKEINILEEGETFVYRERGFVDSNEDGNHARNLQHLKLETSNGACVVAQVHGLWNGNGKGDSEDRITQSQKIREFMQLLDVPAVLVGDFNLRPDTQSVRILEDSGMRNLITEYDIKSTRTALYTKSSEQFADYAFVSEGIDVKDFKVLSDEVSDHAPLYLEFALT